MLVVTIEEWPGGAEVRKYEVGRIFASEMSNKLITNYSIRAEEHGDNYLGTKPSYLQFDINDHDASQSVYVLIKKICEKALEELNTNS